jgi:hypothetical protein
MKRVPLTLAGALLLAGSLSAYAQTERLPPDEKGGAAKQAPAQGEAPQNKPKANSQEQPKVKESQGAGKETGQRAQGQDEKMEKSGDRKQGAQDEDKDKREGQSGKADNKDKRDSDKSAGDAGKPQGGDKSAGDTGKQPGGDNAKGQKHAGKKLEAKQRTVVKETIVKRNVHPVHINFSINVGGVVPRSFELYDLPPVLIEYEPSYSRYKFILADDDTILVIDPETWTIVDIIEV